jgi:hypothetical protein
VCGSAQHWQIKKLKIVVVVVVVVGINKVILLQCKVDLLDQCSIAHRAIAPMPRHRYNHTIRNHKLEFKIDHKQQQQQRSITQ